MNILTLDIEEWFIEKTYHGGRRDRYILFDEYLGRILDLLDTQNIKATFFCVGGMATSFKSVVRSISERGHEIGCHSNAHLWLNKMSYKEVLEDTRIAVDAIEQCIGCKVESYRAPAFSIGKNNLWSLEILAGCGITRDASFFPAKRDFGGFPEFPYKHPAVVKYKGISMKEFPIVTINLLGKDFAFSGGGYFRFFPLWFVESKIKKSAYSMTYFHIGDLLPEHRKILGIKEYEEYYREKGTIKNRTVRYFKSNLGKQKSLDKLIKLIKNTDFVNVNEADKMIKWSDFSGVNLEL